MLVCTDKRGFSKHKRRVFVTTTKNASILVVVLVPGIPPTSHSGVKLAASLLHQQHHSPVHLSTFTLIATQVPDTCLQLSSSSCQASTCTSAAPAVYGIAVNIRPSW